MKLENIDHEYQKFVIDISQKHNLNLDKIKFITAEPAGNFEITDELIDLYLKGKKSAGSSLVEDFVACNDPLPKVGNYWILLDSKKKPKILLETVEIEINKFKDISQKVVTAEGEGDLSIEYWKKTHAKIYEPYLKQWKIKDLDEAHVITEYFRLYK